MGGSGNRAPKLPQGKKKGKTTVDAFGDADKACDTDAGRRRGSGGGDKKSKKSKRSVLGFIVGAASCVALWGWAVYQGVMKQRKDKRVLRSMRKRPLQITEHAECRMECRHIAREEIVSILKDGRINDRKSDPSERPCPKYVVDGEVKNGKDGVKLVTGVFAACPMETVVVTVIDRGTDWPCGPC